MSPSNEEYVRSGEFSRWIQDWRQEEANFRSRLEGRIEAMHIHVKGELAEIKQVVKEANGTGRRNSECIAVIRRDLDALIDEDKEIESTVHAIQEHGCAQMATHGEMLETLGWSSRKKAAVAGGLVGTGALIWPALQKIAEAVHAAITHTP